MIVGTSHFVNFTKACDYYKESGYFEGDWTPAGVEQEIRRKIEEGEISLGQPELKPGDRLLLVDSGTRYAIETST